MRAATLVRATMIVMFVASIGLAGTTVVMTTAQTMLGQVSEQPQAAPQILPEQPVQADPLERQLRPYQVRLNAAGELEGRVNVVNPATGELGTAQEMTIAFLQQGRVVAQRSPGIEGRFQVPLPPGVYSVVGSGPDGYIAYAMHVLPAELTVDNGEAGETQPVAFQEVLSELAIDTVAVPVTDLPMVVNLARSNIPPELLGPNASGSGSTGQPITIDERSQFGQNPDVSLTGHQVQVQEDGRLIGRMHRMDQNGDPVRIRRLNVFLVRDNQVLAQAPVDELGRFEFFDVQDGIYSFIAAGMDGLAAFTMQAVSGPDLADVIPDQLSFVAANGEANAAATTDEGSTRYAVDSAQTSGEQAGVPGMTPPPGEGMAGGAGSGSAGTTGGGATGGGFGGEGAWLPALIAAGIGAGLGYALADDDNDNRVVSPSQP